MGCFFFESYGDHRHLYVLPHAYPTRRSSDLVAFAYRAVRVLPLVMFIVLSKEDPGLRRQVWRFSPSVFGSTAVLLVASQLEGTAQTLTWAAEIGRAHV